MINTLEERFWRKVDRRDPDWCWEWTAAKTQGYGRIGAGRAGAGTLSAHRVAYELLVGPIPKGLTIDHLCRNPGCVNPKHLEPVTNRENLLRGSGFPGTRARQTHCKQGHVFDEENTRHRGTCRECRACDRARWHQRKSTRS